MTKKEFIAALEATAAPDDAPVILFVGDNVGFDITQVRDGHTGPGVFVIGKTVATPEWTDP